MSGPLTDILIGPDVRTLMSRRSALPGRFQVGFLYSLAAEYGTLCIRLVSGSNALAGPYREAPELLGLDPNYALGFHEAAAPRYRNVGPLYICGLWMIPPLEGWTGGQRDTFVQVAALCGLTGPDRPLVVYTPGEPDEEARYRAYLCDPCGGTSEELSALLMPSVSELMAN